MKKLWFLEKFKILILILSEHTICTTFLGGKKIKSLKEKN